MEELLITYLNEYGLIALIGSFLIGVITSLAPCSIVTVPLLVGSAVSLSSDLENKRRFIYAYSLLFVLGLVISFSILMLLVAKVGIMLSVAPFWAYALAGLATLIVLAYSMGYIKGINKDKVTKKLLKFKLFGAIIIGMIFGLVSSPCASVPLITIITVAEQSGWIYSYFLVLSFAIGHAVLLLFAGVSVGFTQSIVSNKFLTNTSRVLNVLFNVMLFGIAVYFIYESYNCF